MVSAEIDPIEKKPLFHFLLGSAEYSIVTVGCNLRCRFCQNWVISQWPKLRKLVDRGEDTSSAVREHPASEWCEETEPPEACWGIGTQVVPSEREIAQEESLRDVYLGNVPMEEGVENTICPGCGTVVVRRWRLTVVENRIRAGRCPDCASSLN
jgi:hypothetical protein